MDYTKDDSITVDLTGMGTLDPYYGAVPPVSVTIGSGTGSYGVDTLVMPNIYVSDTALDWGNLSIGPADKPSGTITLKGEDADIDINGVSLMETLRGIQERLNMLTPDPDMEQEWSELAEIRKQYEAKLAECRSKSKMWKALQHMPLPETE